MFAAEKKSSLLQSHDNISAKEILGFRKHTKKPEISSRCHELTPVFLQMPTVCSALHNLEQTQGHVSGRKKVKGRSTYHEDSTQTVTLDLLHLDAGPWHL